MADHLWVIPVCGGTTADGSGLLNVQWQVGEFPSTASAAAVTANAACAFTLQSGAGAALLDHCNGRWQWTSTSSGLDVATGAQLAVGMPFSRNIGALFTTVTVHAKFMVNTLDRFSNIYLGICDNDGHSSSSLNLTGGMSSNVWKIASWPKASWTNWDDPDNLRVILTFQGTTDYHNVGATGVEVEWFAIELD